MAVPLLVPPLLPVKGLIAGRVGGVFYLLSSPRQSLDKEDKKEVKERPPPPHVIDDVHLLP